MGTSYLLSYLAPFVGSFKCWRSRTETIYCLTVSSYHVTYAFSSESTLIVTWMSRYSLLETGRISEVYVTSTGFELKPLSL